MRPILLALMGWTHRPLTAASGGLLALLLTADPSRADSWESPRPTDYRSASGRYVFKVIPVQIGGPDDVTEPAPPPKPGERLPLGRLEWRHGSETNALWSVQLVNETAPVEAVVADDGQHVVTLDNWHHVGYGPDVVVFYGRKGLIRKYSLEQALAGLVPTGREWYRTLPSPVRYFFDLARLAPPHSGLEERFSHSVSSRWWRENGFHLIESGDGQPLFCLWLAWARKWLVFRMTDGEKVVVTSALRERLTVSGRAWALEQCHNGPSPLEAARYLLSLNRPEDRLGIGAALARRGSLSLSSLLQPVDAAGLRQLAAIPGIRDVRADAHVGERLTLEELLTGLAAFPALELLNLETLPIPDEAAATLGGFRKLRRLGLRATQLTDTGLAAICRNGQLEELWLDETLVSDAGLVALEPLRGLSVLNLERTRVTDVGLVHLAGLTTLTNLHLSGLGITDQGVEHLLKLQDLRELWLVESGVTDAGVARLAGLPRLEQLLLNNAPITDRSLTTFRDMPQLRVVFVWHTALSATGLEDLQHARTNLVLVGP